MRWIAFAILIYLVLVLQTAVAPLLAMHTVWPDFMVVTAVWFALMARAPDAMLACWFIGLAMDLAGLSYQGHSNVGAHALALGLLSIAIVKVRDFTFRESVASQLFYTFFTKLGLCALVGLHMLYVVGELGRFGEVMARGLYEAVYTAALAPYGHWLLRQFRGPLGIVTHERWSAR